MTRRDLIYAALAAAGLALTLVPFARIGVDPHHDGIMLKPALDVLSGQVLFRDTFTQYGALTTYLQVAALVVYPSLLCLKLMTVAAYAATLFLLYATWRLILPRSLTLLSCGLFITFLPGYEKNWLGNFWILIPWSSVLAMLFQALGVYALLRIIRDEQTQRWGLVLGMACASAFWCRQPVGAIVIGTVAVIGLALHWTGWKPVNHSRRDILLWTMGGLAGVTLLLLGSIWFSGAELWGLGLAAARPRLIRRYRPDLPARGVVLYYVIFAALVAWQWQPVLGALSFRDGGWTCVLPMVIVLQSLLSLTQGLAGRAKRKSGEYYLTAALAAVSLSSLLQYYPVPDSWHVFWSLAPAFGLCVYAFWRWCGWSAPIVTVVIAATLLPSVCAKIRLAREQLDQPLVTLTTPSVLRGMRVSPEKADSINQVMRVLDPILRVSPTSRMS